MISPPRPPPSPPEPVVDSSSIASALADPKAAARPPPEHIDRNTRTTARTDSAGEKAASKSDSEAETIVLPGREQDVTPGKRRSIKHQDQKAGGDASPRDLKREKPRLAEHDKVKDQKSSMTSPTESRAKQNDAKRVNGSSRHTDGVADPAPSSSLSSALSSPVDGGQTSKKASSETDRSGPASPSLLDQPDASVGRARKRKLGTDGGEDEPTRDKDEKVRPSLEAAGAGAGVKVEPTEANADRRETRRLARPASPGSDINNRPTSQERSTSPHGRTQRRLPAAQAASALTNGKSHKKRRVVPPPLTQRDSRRHDEAGSDDSSPGASPPPTGASRKPGSAELISPAKMPHKKHRDQIGRTFLARACAAHEVDGVLMRLKERPEDIDIADNAGNTPLQIASLEGSADIVKILIDHGCDISCKNHEKDTPLIDAVENGHLDVVRLLLEAGANPRQGNLNGEEPLDLLNNEDENAGAIRKALVAAKNRSSARRVSEDQSSGKDGAGKGEARLSRAPSAASPRHSPPATNPRSPPIGTVPLRRKTVRSEATRNDLLWMKPTAENLRDRAGKGDMAGVANILNVLSQADAESLIAAARGGHDEVIQLLLGIGGADADAPPVRSHKAGHNTPMLAAIGRGNEKVIQLLLEQPAFDPTRRDHRGMAYHEIAQERQGHNWEKEVEILKKAYDAHTKPHKARASHGSKSSSPASQRSGRDGEREREKKSAARTAGQVAPTAVMASSRSEEPRRKSQTGSEKETTPLGPPKARRRDPKQSPSDNVGVSSDGEGAKPRRKLVSGKVLKGDREFKRRPSTGSVASTASAPADTGERESRRTDDSGREVKRQAAQLSEDKKKKATTRPRSSTSDSDLPAERRKSKATAREESKDRLSVVRGEGSLKRSRTSESPVRSRSRDSDGETLSTDEFKKKRRRLELEGKVSKAKVKRREEEGRDGPVDKDAKTLARAAKDEPKGSEISKSTVKIETQRAKLNALRKAAGDGAKGPTSKVEEVKQGKANARTQTIESKANDRGKSEPATKERVEDERRKKARVEREEVERREAERQAQEAQRAKEAQEQKEREERERAERRAREEAEEQERAKKQAEEERKRVEAEERARRIQAEKEEAERQARLAREAEEARAEERRKAEEAERLARIAREEEQARIERKRREEEQQRRRAEQERLRREEAERRRAEQEKREMMELMRRQEEQERARREALPYAMQRLAELPAQSSRTAQEAMQFMPFFFTTFAQSGAQTQANGEAEQERWIVNFQVAAVLGVKDLGLSQYTAWAKRPITGRQKCLLWRVVRLQLSGQIPFGLDGLGVALRDRITQAKFRAMEPVFWIKLADFEDIMPRYPHLQGLRLSLMPLPADIKDQACPPVGIFKDADGWTVTPYHEGQWTSYTQVINERSHEYPPDRHLFRPISAPLASPGPKLALLPNGIVEH